MTLSASFSLSLLLSVVVQGGAIGAQREQDDLLERKLASPFLKSAPWVLDIDKARADSKRRGVPIFGYFTTSGP